jgi:hypothetical protein
MIGSMHASLSGAWKSINKLRSEVAASFGETQGYTMYAISMVLERGFDSLFL